MGWRMQSKNGGFAAFETDSTRYHMNEIPSADHGPILDPPTSDVSARCVSLLAEIGCHGWALGEGLRFLRKEQERDGSWFGRWGTNYIYGTCWVLIALQNAGDGPELFHVRRAADWLKGCQWPNGGWGEDCDTYSHPERGGTGTRAPSSRPPGRCSA